jgi:hypothetical protein
MIQIFLLTFDSNTYDFIMEFDFGVFQMMYLLNLQEK